MRFQLPQIYVCIFILSGSCICIRLISGICLDENLDMHAVCIQIFKII